MVEKRLSKISATEQAFNETTPYYNNALRSSGYKMTLKYNPDKIPDNMEKDNENLIMISNEDRQQIANGHRQKEMKEKDSMEKHNSLLYNSQKNMNDKEDLAYSENAKQKQNKRKKKRRRNIIWFNPPYNTSVTTNIGKQFLKLIDIHFPKDRKDKLYKIFNRHLVKLSYSCTPNMKTIVTAHNTKILKKHTAANNHED